MVYLIVVWIGVGGQITAPPPIPFADARACAIAGDALIASANKFNDTGALKMMNIVQCSNMASGKVS